MNSEPKSLLANIKLLKQPQLYLLRRSKSNYFSSQIKSSRSSSVALRKSYKFSQLAENRVKNTNFSSCLFNQAHKIDPCSRIETPNNSDKIRTILIHRQKTQRTLKNSKISKTRSLNWNPSNFPDEIKENKQKEESCPKTIVSLSSLTLLIMNECQGQIDQISTKRKSSKILATNSTSLKRIKNQPQYNKEPTGDNPYELIPLRKGKRCKENRIKGSCLQD